MLIFYVLPRLLARIFSQDFYYIFHYKISFLFLLNLIDCFKLLFIEQYPRLLQESLILDDFLFYHCDCTIFQSS